jgi:uncharacterized protein YbjT (DUF2867 family)
MFLVLGITGRVGGATAQNLLAKGYKVRALVRDPGKAADWGSQGVELVQGDFSDAAALTGALRGVEGAYVMLPPIMTPQRGFPEANAIIAGYVDAFGRVPPPRLVVLSSIGSEKPHGLGLITQTHMLEEALAPFTFPIAFIRAGSFFENNISLLPVAAQSGHFYTFYQPVERPVPSIATGDIGALAAQLLTDKSWTGRRIIELGSRYSPTQIASAISEVLGRPVIAQAVPRERWAATLESFGFPPGSTWAYEEMVDSINSGWIDFGAPGAERVPATTKPQQVYATAHSSQH